MRDYGEKRKIVLEIDVDDEADEGQLLVTADSMKSWIKKVRQLP